MFRNFMYCRKSASQKIKFALFVPHMKIIYLKVSFVITKYCHKFLTSFFFSSLLCYKYIFTVFVRVRESYQNFIKEKETEVKRAKFHFLLSKDFL